MRASAGSLMHNFKKRFRFERQSLRHRVLRMLQRKLAPAGNQINFGEVAMSAQGQKEK